MILRRLTIAIRKQDWFTVLIETLIVVLGVFLGIQLGNWNEERAEKARYLEARAHLLDETRANITLAEGYTDRYMRRLGHVRAAISVLRNCETGPEALAQLHLGLDTLRSTPGFVPQTSLIEFITEDDAMLRQQVEEERARLQDFRQQFITLASGAKVVEHTPDRSPIEDHPMVTYGALSDDYVPMNGADERPIILAVPLEEACTDMALAKHFYLWERIGGFSILIGERAQSLLNENLEAMEGAAED